jgi:hypothetical protein
MSASTLLRLRSLLLVLWLAALTLGCSALSEQPLQRVSYPSAPLRLSVQAVNGSVGLSVAAAPKPGDLRFAVQTANAAWSPRFKTSVELYNKQVRFTDVNTQRAVTFPANSFLLHGGEGGENGQH